MRQRLVASAVCVALVAALAAGPAAGQTTTTPTTEAVDPDATGILPQPDSGAAPDDPGDRGGWAQLAVLALVVAGLGAVTALVVRSARRAGATGPGPGPPAGAR